MCENKYNHDNKKVQGKLGIELTKYIQFFYQCSDKIILNITDLTKFPV